MELGGDSVGLQKALKDVDDKAKALSSEMREVDRALKLDPTNTELLAQKQKLLSEQVENAKEKLRQLRDVQEQVTQQFEKGEIGEEAYRAFQREVAVAESNVKRLDGQLDEVNQTINAASDSTDDLSDSLDDAGDETKELGKEVESSEGKLKKFGEVAKEVGKIAAAALAAIGAAAVATGKKIWDMSNETAAAGDEIDKTSQKIGISAESYQEWGYVFERCGADVNHLQTGMKKLSGVIADAGNGSDSAKEKLAAVGLTIDDLNGKSQDEQLSVVITALQDMESGAERTAAATDLLGNSAVDMAAVLNTGAEETQALKDEAKEYGMIMSNEAVAASAAFEDSLTKLNRTVSGVKNRLTSDLLPGLSDIMDGFSDLVAGNDHAAEKIEKGVNDLLKKISKMIPRIAGMIGTVVAAVAKSAPDIIMALADGLIGALPELIPIAAEMVAGIVNGLVTLLPQMTDSLMKIVVSVIESVSRMLPTLMPQLIEALTRLLQMLTDQLPLLLKAGLQLVLGLAEGILEAIPVLIGALPELIVSIVDFLLGSIPDIIQAGIDLLTALVDALPSIIEQIAEVLPQIITGIIDTLMDNLPLIVQAGIDLLVALVHDLPAIIKAIVDVIPTIIDSVVSALVDAVPQLIEAGVELFLSLVENLPQIIEGIVTAVPKIIDSVVNALIDAIPLLIEAGIKLFTAIIHNLPKIIVTITSKIPQIIKGIVDAFGSLVSKMWQIGRHLIEGLWDGIKSMGSWLGDRCRDFGNAWVSGFKTIFGIHSPSTLFRDEIGKNLALGLGVGFTDNMEKVRRDMQKALPTSFDIDPQMTVSSVSQLGAGLSEEAAKANEQVVFYMNIGSFTNRSDRDIDELMEYAGNRFASQMERRSRVF